MNWVIGRDVRKIEWGHRTVFDGYLWLIMTEYDYCSSGLLRLLSEALDESAYHDCEGALLECLGEMMFDV